MDDIHKHFTVVYVPPIRDLNTDGLDPLKKIFSDTLNKSRVSATLKAKIKSTQSELKDKAQAILANHKELTQDVLKADSLDVDVPDIQIDNLFDALSLIVKTGTKKIGLSDFGTGHQSSVIMHLYRQLGEVTSGETIYLFEEPDNHLHPTTIRAIGADLQKISERSQVVLSTHSPILLNHIGYENIISLYQDANMITQKRNFDLTRYAGKDIRILMNQYGIRFTEPLLCNKVVLVEGPCDVTVLSTMIYLRYKKSPDQLDILLIPTGGKDGIVTLYQFMKAINVNCIAIFDWDAAFNDQKPFIVPTATRLIFDDLKESVDKILPQLDTTYKRGRKARTILKEIYNEASNGPTKKTTFEGSQLEKVVLTTKALTQLERIELKKAIKEKRKTKYKALLRKSNVWIWFGAIEDALLQGGGSEDVVEQTLIALGKLDAPLVIPIAHKKNRLINILHNSGHEPHVLQRVVIDLERAHKFSKAELSHAVNFVVEGVV